MNTDTMIDHLYFIKKVTFEGTENHIVELFSLTKEKIEKTEGKNVFNLEVLASSIREVSSNIIDQPNIYEDLKKYISEEAAEKIYLTVTEEEAFAELINSHFK
ncbi:MULTISPECIES: hypothetical protein [Bacillota]|uniref:hypothetical protein n=1 Tax=Bacillota TaxID=1239 RepID=UPI0039EEF97B